MTYTKQHEALRLADWLDDHLRGSTKTVAQPAGEYPPLPEPYHVAYDDIDKEDVKCFAEGQLRAYVDTDRAMRAQAAPQADSVPKASFDNPMVQAVYAILCEDAEPPKGEHWEGFVARRIVDALSADSVLEDAARYRLVRRGQHWSVINGVGDTLRAEELDAAIDAAHPAVPVAQGDALTDTYVQQVPDKCDRIVWRGRYYHLPIDAAEHSYTEPSPMAKVAAALRQKAEQEDAAYQARRSDQGLMESEWGPMEDAPPHEDPPMHVAVVEGDDTVRTLQWNRDVAAFAYPAGTLLYAARSQAKEGA